MANLHGHAWTVRPFLEHVTRPGGTPSSRHFRASLEDPVRGTVRVTGRLGPDLSDELLIVVHGLGGSATSHYTHFATRAASRAGISCLRLELRGAARNGDDVYHAGLTDDLRAALASPSLARFRRVHILGYSVGGHITLRYASEGAVDPRVTGVAAVCPPIDLRGGVEEIDKPKGAFYRRHVLAGLKQMYVVAYARRAMSISPREALLIRGIREWDDLVVAPRFGFANADDYYAKASVAPHLAKITIPSLVVVAEADPMVFTHVVRPWLDAAHNIERVYARGGHVGFPADIDLRLGGRGSLEDQVIDWLRRRDDTTE